MEVKCVMSMACHGTCAGVGTGGCALVKQDAPVLQGQLQLASWQSALHLGRALIDGSKQVMQA